MRSALVCEGKRGGSRRSREFGEVLTHGIDEAVYLGQRVAVMTSRPGSIKQVIDIPLESRSREEDLRGTPEFSQLRHEVWSLLRDEFRQAQILERERVSGAAA